MRDFRKHTGWYLTGYPAGPEVRRRLANVEHAWPSWTTCWPRSTRTWRWFPAACGSGAATPTGPARCTCPTAGWTTSTTPRPLAREADALVSGG